MVETAQIENNPLKSFFRKPGIWIKLPSQGKFYSQPLADINAQGEIPIYPMTAKDEIVLKNADALLNGSAIRQLISSCVPCIKNVDEMPALDLDAILVAIRRATYGDGYDVTAECDCDKKSKTEFTVNLDRVISSIKIVEDIKPIDLESGIKVFVRPITVKSILNLNWTQFEQMRNLQMAEQKNLSQEEQLKIVNSSYDVLLDSSIKTVANCIEEVLLPDGVVVNDHAQIFEWAAQMARPEFKQLETSLLEISELGINKNLDVQCGSCEKSFKTTLDLNPTTFFA
jgi:hypothetical protein